jgi:V/A-type H+-transporting ATPase subunit I
MVKVDIYLLKKDLQKVLSKLQTSRLVQVIADQTAREPMSNKELTILRSRIDDMISFLEPFEPSVKGLSAALNGPEPMEVSRVFYHDLKGWLAGAERSLHPLRSSMGSLDDELEASRDLTDRLRPLSGLDLVLSGLGHLSMVRVKVGLTRRYDELDRAVQNASGDIIGSLLDRKEGLHAVRIIYPRSSAGPLEEHLKGKLFSELTINTDRMKALSERNKMGDDLLSYPVPKVLSKLEDLSQSLLAKKAHLSKEASNLSLKLLPRARSSREQLELDLEREKVAISLRSTRYTNVITGWAEKDRLKELNDLVGSATGGVFHITARAPTSSETGEDKVPIKMKNRFLGRLFEPLAVTFAAPRYNEIDPSSWISVPFIIIFGLMLGDIGYGLMFALAGLFIILKVRRSRSMRDIGYLVTILGISSILAGLWMGAFFGDLVPRLIYGDPTRPLYALTVLGYQLPYDSLRDPMFLFMMSMVIGLLQLNLGFVLLGADRVKNGSVFGFVKGTISWFLVQTGAIIFIGDFLLKAWEMDGMLSIIALVTFLTGTVLLIIEVKGMVFFSMEGLLGDVISYTRILALGLSTFGLAMAFNIIAEMVMDLGSLLIPVAVVLLVFLHIFNFLIQILGGFVHSLRLQYVEFFGKFYSGGGTLFTPFGRERVLTKVSDPECLKEVDCV